MGFPENLLLLGGPPGWVAYYFIWKAKDERERKKFYEAWLDYNPDKVLGDARFADAKMLADAQAFDDRDGIPLGYFDGKPIYHNAATSIVTLGQSGIGKGSQILIPAALQCPHLSFVIPVIDVEAFNCTAEQRSRYGPVYVIDPYGMFPDVLRKIPRARYNPMSLPWLAPSHPLFSARTAKLSTGVIPHGHAKDEYWNLSSRQLWTEFAMTLRRYARDEQVNLTRVAELISGDPFHFARWAMRMIDDPYLRGKMSRWANPDALEVRSLPEVLENAKTHVNPWLDEPVYETTCTSTFNFSQCAEQVMTVYMLAPHDLLDMGPAKVFSTLTTAALGELVRFNPRRRVRTIVMLDEFFELPLNGIDHTLISARKANTVLWLCLQDVAELKDLYSRTFETILNSAGCVQILGASDLEGSTLVSNLLGQTEVTTKTKTWSHSAAYTYLSDPPTWEQLRKLNSTINESRQVRPLMLPQEVRWLGKSKAGNEQQILFMRGAAAPILAERKSYLDVPKLRRIAGKNPYYNDSRASRGNSTGDDWKRLLA